MEESHWPELEMLKDPDKLRNNIGSLLDFFTQKLEAGEIKLCHLVEGLERILVHPSPVERAVGTRFLVDILGSLSTFKINPEELEFLIAFFIDRLKDHHSVIPHVVTGFLSLVKWPNISSKNVQEIIQALFREVHCQSQVMADRRNIYNILKYCVLNKTKDVKELNTEFVLGFISAMEGEKDPRNLLLLFSLIPHITRHFSLENFAEDLFEVIAAYFPIDFIPPAQDPYGILPEDLILGLRGTLASTDAFAPFCIPLLMEKLDSLILGAKLDALLTLKACCCGNYSAGSLRPFVLILWSSLRREVVEGRHTEVEDAALSALESVVSALEAGLEDTSPSSAISKQSIKDGLSQLGLAALTECLGHMSSPEQRLMHPSSQLLLAVSSPSCYLTMMVCEKVLPLMVHQFEDKTEPVARKRTLEAIAAFLKQGAKFTIFEEVPFCEMRSSCLDVLLKGLSANDLSVKEASLISLAHAQSAFSVGENVTVYRRLLDLSLDNDRRGNTSDLVVKALHCFTRPKASVEVEDVLSTILNHLEADHAAEDECNQMLLDTLLAVVGTSVEALTKTMPFLWEQAQQYLMDGRSSSCIQYLACIRKIVKGVERGGSSFAFLYHDWCGVARCQFLAASAIQCNLALDLVPVLEEISGICRSLVTGTCRKDQGVIDAFVGLLLGKKHPSDIDLLMEYLEGKVAKPESDLASLIDISSDGTIDSSIGSPLAVFCLWGLISLGEEPIPARHFTVLMTQLRHWSFFSKDQRIRDTAASLVASQIIRIQESELDKLLRCLEDEVFPIGILDPGTTNLSVSSIRFLGWVVKGLVMRGYHDDGHWIQKLENLLLSNEFGSSASECYEFLLSDVSSLGVSSTHSKTPPFFRMLYKQRFFECRIDGLVKQAREATGKGRMYTLLAISYLLPRLPDAVLKGHLVKLLPVLVDGLTCGDPIVSSGTVETLGSLLRHNVGGVSSHVSTLVPPLLEKTTRTPIKVRLNALECLGALASLPTTVIVPLKRQVLQGLKPSLGDTKRLVRRAATTATSAWVLV